MIPRTIFSAEHELFRDTVRRFVADEIEPRYAEWEAAGRVPRDVWLAAGKIGLLCPAVPEADGGPGGDFLHGAVVTEEMARSGFVAPTFYLQNDIVSPYLVHHGTPAQKQRWLPGMVSGEVVGAVGMSEPSGGSDLANLRTTARLEDDEYVVNGQKVFVTGGHTADLLVLACRTGEGPGAKGVSLLLVDTDSPGYHRGRTLDKIGCKAQDTSELFFDGLRVPAANLLGEPGRGFAVLMSELAQERLVQAVRAVAAAEAMIEYTLRYCADREIYDGRLSDLQNTRFVLATVHADTMAQRALVDRAMAAHAAGELDATDAAAVKLTTTRLQCRVADECLQLHGGWGYMTEYPIARAFVDARMTTVGGGSAEVMKHIIGRALFRGLMP